METHTNTSMCNILIVYVTYSSLCHALPAIVTLKKCNEAKHGDLPVIGTERSDIYEKCSALIAEINILDVNFKYVYNLS